MKINHKNIFIINFLTITFEVFLTFVILFGRSFTGIYIFGFRIGELLIGLLIMIFPFTFYMYIKKNFQYISKRVVEIQTALVIFFILSVLLNGNNLTNLYIFKSSTFIWTTFFLYIGILYSKFAINKLRFFNILWLSTYIAYILSAVYFPDFIWNFFSEHSDKVDFIKGSDLLLIFVLTNYLNKKYSNNNYLYIFNFFISSGLLLPMLLFKSKGAFLPAFIYILFELLYSKKYFYKHRLSTLLALFFTGFIFSFSTLYIWGDFSFSKNPQDTVVSIVSNLSSTGEALQEISEQKNTIDAFFSLYYNPLNNRLMSTEGMANWRLLIWQDVFWDLEKKDKLLTGYGYGSIIPAMEQRDRQGWDGENEHVHNFAINILARSGFVGFSLMILFYFFLVKEFLEKDRKNFNDILIFILPILITASFDPALESVRFPLIFYTFLGIFYTDRNLKIFNKK